MGGVGGAHIHPQTHITEHIIAEYICLSHPAGDEGKGRRCRSELDWSLMRCSVPDISSGDNWLSDRVRHGCCGLFMSGRWDYVQLSLSLVIEVTSEDRGRVQIVC